MVRHNNVVPNQHFHKKWQRRVKTWLQQPIQKKLRRDKRRVKAAEIAPRPVAGPLRPLVHCPTQKYNTKVRLGRGFTLDELKEAKINPKFAKTVGIAVDHRRSNKCIESLKLNVQRLMDYQARLVVFPRKNRKVPKSGDSSKEEIAQVTQLKGDIIKKTSTADVVSLVALTEDMKAFGAHSTLRNAMNDAKLVGVRMKKAKDGKDEKKDGPSKGADDE
jgi:large subunit ribosomal protein L13e